VPELDQHMSRGFMMRELAGANWASLGHVRLLQGYNTLILRSLAQLLAPDRAAPSTWMPEEGDIGAFSLLARGDHALDLLRGGLMVTRAQGLTARRVQRSILLDSPADDPRWSEVHVPDRGDLKFYVNRRALPVAWLVPRARLVSREDALALIHGRASLPLFDPNEEALSETPIPGLDEASETDADRTSRHGAVEVVEYRDDVIRLKVRSPRGTLLVTSELAYPGWTPTIDGRAGEALIVNAGFRAVVVPEGIHEVTWLYRPLLARVGHGIGLASLCAIGGCWLLGRRRPSPTGRNPTRACAT